MFSSEYGIAETYQVPIIKRGVVDFAVGADWTPVTGDVKVSIDGAAAVNTATLPTAVVMGNTAYWSFPVSAAHHTGRRIIVTVADAVTKAVEDQSFVILTRDHPSAHDPRGVIFAGTAAAGAVNSLTFPSGHSALICRSGNVIVAVGGTGSGQQATIAGYTSGTGVVTFVNNVPTAFDPTTRFRVYPGEAAPTPADIAVAVGAEAAANPFAMNIEQVNNVPIQGVGTPASPWIPA